MATFTKEMVDKYANLLLIGLSDEENKMVLDEFDIIDKTCDAVNEIENIDRVIPMTHCLDDFYTDLNEDVSFDNVDVDLLLKNAGRKTDREIEIPRVVE